MEYAKPVQKKEKKTSLPKKLQSGIEHLSGYSMNDVNVHRNSSEPAKVGALAFARGSDIFLGAGQEKHLPHEAWHVAQQKQGRVKATTQMKGGANINDDAGLEKEADIMGAKAAQFTVSRPAAVAQRQPIASVDNSAQPSQLKVAQLVKKKDPIEDAALDEDIDSIRADVNAAMEKIKKAILSLAKEDKRIKKALSKSGRDWLIYAPIASWYRNMLGLLENWDSSWSLEATGGLLIDIAAAMKEFGDETQNLINPKMKKSRQKDKKANKQSDWVQELPDGTQVQAGVSASSALLLRMISFLDVTNPEEIEAIMNAVILYWKNSKLKQALGQFHTAAEVWAVYTRFLEDQYEAAVESESVVEEEEQTDEAPPPEDSNHNSKL